MTDLLVVAQVMGFYGSWAIWVLALGFAVATSIHHNYPPGIPVALFGITGCVLTAAVVVAHVLSTAWAAIPR